MIFSILETEIGECVIELDDEGIQYLKEGLQQLELAEAGEEWETPSIITNDGKLEAISQLVLRRK